VGLKNYDSTAPKRQDMALIDNTEFSDLCTTCNHITTCVHGKKRIEPIWFCEQFDDFQPAPKRIWLKSKPEAPAADHEKSKTLKGLCMNCDYAENCTLHKPEAGIWHCEEYS